jgi:hypothetical protein
LKYSPILKVIPNIVDNFRRSFPTGVSILRTIIPLKGLHCTASSELAISLLFFLKKIKKAVQKNSSAWGFEYQIKKRTDGNGCTRNQTKKKKKSRGAQREP